MVIFLVAQFTLAPRVYMYIHRHCICNIYFTLPLYNNICNVFHNNIIIVCAEVIQTIRYDFSIDVINPYCLCYVLC